MKHEAVGHHKMHDLADMLNIPIYAAHGIMEMIWHYAGDQSPCGDIGKLSNVAIARGCSWDRKPDELISALVAVKFLDEIEPYRLIIHDWPSHAQDWIRKKLKRTNGKLDWLPVYRVSVYNEQFTNDWSRTGHGLVTVGTNSPPAEGSVVKLRGVKVSVVSENQRTEHSPSPTSETLSDIADALQRYVQHFKIDWPLPDVAICRKVYTALGANGDWSEKLRGALIDLESTKQKPGRSYAWFESVIKTRLEESNGS